MSGKAPALQPQLDSSSGNVELSNIAQVDGGASGERDIMQLARLGDIPGIQRLFDENKFIPSYCDEEGITPLHWAAINNQYATCKFLLDSGADANKRGGESVATPAMWAAQQSHYYVIHLLLQYGADPLVTDVKGFNILHLATCEGNVFLLVILLHQNIPVDTRDAQGHTSLMWAAYTGFPACVDLFLRWGADVHATDENGLTALHWALVKGNPGCIQKLVEYGADRLALSLTGETPTMMAEKMKTDHIWRRVLTECGYEADGTPIKFGLPSFFGDRRTFTIRFFYFLPFVIIWVMLMILSQMSVYVAVPLSLFTGYILMYLGQKLLMFAPLDMKQIHKTTVLTGIFGGTLCFLGVRWLTVILPATYASKPFSNLAFGLCYVLCTYFYFYCMMHDPGFVPKLASLTEQRSVINELISSWKFDDENFCVRCMLRRPLRSKHCKICKRCVAKHDHHCPWVFNCVGVNNHRQFFIYLLSLEAGVSLIVWITFEYYASMANLPDTECNILSPALCSYVYADSYTLVLVAWTALQLTWVTMLLVVQFVQVSRALTTYESMHGAHHVHGSKASEAITMALTTGTSSLDAAQLGPRNRGPDPAASHAHHAHQHRSWLGQWKKLLGIDSFMETALHKDKRRSVKKRNPFSRGCLQNCKDFWCDSSPLFGHRESGIALLNGQPVNYTMMYEPPSQFSVRSRPTEAAHREYEQVSQEEDIV